MLSKKQLASELAPLAWPVTRWLVQTSPTTVLAVRSAMKSPVTRKVMQGFAVVGREVTMAMARAAEHPRYYPPQPRYYPPTPSTTYSEGTDMTFGRASRDPDLKDLQKLTRNLSETADDLLEEQEDKRRFDALPEFVIREVREVRVKARTEADAIEIAKIAFKHGQDEDNRIDRDLLSSNRIRGNTISKIRRVSTKVARFFD